MPVLAFSTEFILKVKRFLEALDLKDRFLSRLATSITEAYGDVELHIIGMVIERTFATFAANTRQIATRISVNGPLFTYTYQRMDRINRTNPNKREYCF